MGQIYGQVSQAGGGSGQHGGAGHGGANTPFYESPGQNRKKGLNIIQCHVSFIKIQALEEIIFASQLPKNKTVLGLEQGEKSKCTLLQLHIHF